MKVLVTGGAGYIGSHMLLKLLEAGHQPIVIDNLSTGMQSRIPSHVPLHVFDIADADRLNNFFKKEKIDVVMHFAASIEVGESVEHPAKYYQNNVVGTLNLLNEMRKNNVKKIIFSSTAATFGNPIYVPVDEAHPQNPINPYGASKLMCETILKDFDAAYGIKSVSLRYFNAAGADPEKRTGFRKNDASHLIPVVLNAANCENTMIKINGTDYDTKDGTCVRDYVHVMDLCEAHLLAMHYLLNGGETCAFNLGNGVGYSVLDVISAAAKVTGKKINTVESSRRLGDPASLVADSTLARKKLAWQPQYPEIEAVVSHAWEFVSEV